MHLGNSLRTSESSNFDMQTAHSRPSFEPLREENLKKGRELINSSSIPENLDLDRISP
jgi:hypothetical protein